jgi:hypothetical protein
LNTSIRQALVEDLGEVGESDGDGFAESGTMLLAQRFFIGGLHVLLSRSQRINKGVRLRPAELFGDLAA